MRGDRPPWHDPVSRLLRFVWDLETETVIASHPGYNPVAFSPDGTTLATGDGFGIILRGQTDRYLSGHTAGVRSVSFSPDGVVLASGAGDETVRLWDVAAAQEIATLQGHTGEVASVSFSPDGTLLVSSGGGWDDPTILLWDVAAQTEVARLTGHRGRITSVTFSPDGATVASGSVDGTVRLWDVATGREVSTLEHSDEVTAVSFSPDGAILASGAGKTVRLRDYFSKEERELFTLGHPSRVAAVSFSPEATFLASGLGDGTIKLWDVSEWTGPRPRQAVGISGDQQQGKAGEKLRDPFVVEVRDQDDNPLSEALVTFRVISGEGKIDGKFTLARVTTDADGRAEVFLTLDPNPGNNTVEAVVPGLGVLAFTAVGRGTPDLSHAERWKLPEGVRLRLGKGSIGRSDRAIAFSPDSRLLAVASGIGLWLYDMEAPERPALLPLELANSVSFSPDGTTLASGSGWSSGKLVLWDVATGTQTATLEEAGWVKYVAFSPDGKRLASGASAPWVELWDPTAHLHAATLRGHASPGRCVSFSPDGTTLASGEEDGTLRLYDLTTGTHSILAEGQDEIESVSFSPDGTTLASASGDGTVRLWDVATGTNTAILEGHEAHVLCVAFSPDGATLGSGGWNGSLKLWNTATGRNVATFPPHGGRVRAVSFSPDGKSFASAGEDGEVRVWELASGSGLVLSGNAAYIGAMAFSPDGSMLASHSSDAWGGTIDLWDAVTGRKIATLFGHTRRVYSMSFSPDGTLLASGSDDRKVYLWDLATHTAITAFEGTGPVTTVSFSPNGTTLATGSGETVDLWDVATQRHTAAFSNQSKISLVSFSPDGTLLATGDNRGEVTLWDVATGTATAHLEHGAERVSSLSFSLDGSTLFSGSSRDGRLKAWDVKETTSLATLEKGYVDVLSFSPDGTLFATGTQDNLARIWDLETGTVIATLEGHAHHVTRVLFSPDGRTLASGSRDGTVLLWDFELVLPHPRTLTKLSGDRQHGLPGSQLTQPFAVSVLDQNGDPLAGATVAFTVTAGGGTLSAATATTDENGRAATTLTLGSEPVGNTVTARVADLKPVIFRATGQAIPTTLAKLSGDEQEGPEGAALPESFVVEVRDQNNNPLVGAPVAFLVTSGEGILSVATDTTDANGRASSTLTLGNGPGAVTVTVTVAGLDPVTFTAATAQATADFDGDGQTGFGDFFLFADAFGSSDPRFDLDGSGRVDFADFFLFADYFVDPARGKLMALAAELIGLPDGPQLQQNHPNPFNSETVISWFQLRPGPARVEVFALTGQRVAILHQGPTKAGMHRLRWDGRDDQGRPVASGVHLYRLVIDEGVHTRKLTLLR